MVLAGLERADGSLASPVRGDLATALQMIALLLPAILPGAAAGERKRFQGLVFRGGV